MPVKTYIIHEPLVAIGPIRSHMIRKIMSLGDKVFITTSCSDTFEYSHVVGTDADEFMFYVNKGTALICVGSARQHDVHNRCLRCGWLDGLDRKKTVDLSTEVICTAGSELDRFVKLFTYTLLGVSGSMEVIKS